MERSNVDKAWDHIAGIDRNYPAWPQTFNTCKSEKCKNKARGRGYCADCHTKKLAEYVGDSVASHYHESVKLIKNMTTKMMDFIREKELKEDE